MVEKIFISYNHLDKSQATKVIKKLKAEGFEVIWDDDAMKSGDNIRKFIIKSIKESDLTLLLVSRNSLLSAWVAMETINSQNAVVLGEHNFVSAYIDDTVLSRKFTDIALDNIEREISEISELIKLRLSKGWGIQDLHTELQRYRSLQHGIDGIISKLKDSFYIDISGEFFEKGMNKLITDLKNHIGIPDVNFSTSCTYDSYEFQSDFLIYSKKYQGNKLPLLLIDGYEGGDHYITDQWNPETRVHNYQMYDDVIERRILPGTQKQYPFLTTGDFLEDHIVRLSIPLNSDDFVVPPSSDSEARFLIPIKKRFFEYFNTTDIDRLLKIKEDKQYDGKSIVWVMLQIPIKGGRKVITLNRRYLINPFEKDDQGYFKDGKIIEGKQSLTFFPFLRTNDPKIDTYYKVLVSDADNNPVSINCKTTLSFFSYKESGLEKVNPIKQKIRHNKVNGYEPLTDEYFEFDKVFDVIEIVLPYPKDNNVTIKGLLIPKWKECSTNGNEFKFGIDFGTNNTHIAYNSVTNKPPEPLKILESEKLVVNTCKKGNSNIFEIFRNHDFLPEEIKKGKLHSFPIRTAIQENIDFTISSRIPDIFGDINIAFMYEKDIIHKGQKVITDLKWVPAANPLEQNRIKAFFYEIILLIKYKVIANGGDLNNTKICWLYPISLPSFGKVNFRRYWYSACQDILGDGVGKINEMTESVTPFIFFSKTGVIPQSCKRVLCIDIGSGSSDILLVSDKEKFGTSVRFTSNVLWGEGYKGKEVNGSVIPYNLDNAYSEAYIKYRKENNIGVNLVESLEKEFPDVVSNNETRSKVGLLYNLISDKKSFYSSHDIISYIFDLEESVRPNIKFSEHVINHYISLRFPMYLHFTAILYFSVKFIIDLLKKGKNLESPNYVIFSGKGSMYLSMLAPILELEKICKYIFQYSIKTDKWLIENPDKKLEQSSVIKFILPQSPKEVTANGAIYGMEGSYEDVKEHTYLGVTSDFSFENYNKSNTENHKRNPLLNPIEYFDYNNEDYYTKKIISNDQVLSSVIENQENFLRIALNYKGLIRDSHWMGLDNDKLEKIANFFSENEYYRMKNSLNAFIQSTKDQGDVVNETLFFYPLIHSIYELGKFIFNRYDK